MNETTLSLGNFIVVRRFSERHLDPGPASAEESLKQVIIVNSGRPAESGGIYEKYEGICRHGRD